MHADLLASAADLVRQCPCPRGCPSCVGPVTAAAFEMWGVPTIVPDRSRLAGMVKQLETELPTRRDGVDVRLADGRTLLVHSDSLLLDGVPVELSPAPLSVLDSLLVNPGHVVSRRALQLYAAPLAELPDVLAGTLRRRWPGTEPAPADIPESLPSWQAYSRS